MSSTDKSSSGLRFDKVHCRFGSRRRGVAALVSFSLHCRPGSTTCLIGANGAGKSTALALAAALQQPTSGSVSFAGRPVTMAGFPAPLGYLPQTSAFPDALEVAEVLAFSFAARATPVPSRAETLEVTGLSEVIGHRTGTLSSGWKRRLGLAVALAVPGDVLLLDEPFVGLDFATLERLVAHLHRRRQQGATILLASHDFETIDRLQPRVVVLQDGRLLGRRDAGQTGAREIYRNVTAVPNDTRTERARDATT